MGKDDKNAFQRCVLNMQVWVVAEITSDTLRPMVGQCVVNQNKKLMAIVYCICCYNFSCHPNVSTKVGT